MVRISNRVKRNIYAALLVVGGGCMIVRGWEVAMNPTSGSAWFELSGITLLTYLCFDSYMVYRRRVKNGILFGRR